MPAAFASFLSRGPRSTGPRRLVVGWIFLTNELTVIAMGSRAARTFTQAVHSAVPPRSVQGNKDPVLTRHVSQPLTSEQPAARLPRTGMPASKCLRRLHNAVLGMEPEAVARCQRDAVRSCEASSCRRSPSLSSLAHVRRLVQMLYRQAG